MSIIRKASKRILWSTYDPRVRSRHRAPQILSIDATVDQVLSGKSLARYGDGEFLVMQGRDIGFQRTDPAMAQMLASILKHPPANVLVCLPDVFGRLDYLTAQAANVWRDALSTNRRRWYQALDMSETYGNAFVSRFYIDWRDKNANEEAIQRLVGLWANREVVVVEGLLTRFGVGTPVLDNAARVRRTLCPAEHSFEARELILEAMEEVDRDCIVLLALGPTATVLSVDLTRAGFQAIDIGHLDLEMLWHQMGATKKVPVAHKYVNEIGHASLSDQVADRQYDEQVFRRIAV